MELVSIESEGATYTFKPQEIARAQTQHAGYLNDFISRPALPFHNLTSFSPIESQEDNFEHHSMIQTLCWRGCGRKNHVILQRSPLFGTILSARGSLSKVTVNLSSRRITYEGMYNILSLKGGYRLADAKEEHQETHHMNIILSTVDGTGTFGGPVVRSLIAATNVQATLLRFKSC